MEGARQALSALLSSSPLGVGVDSPGRGLYERDKEQVVDYCRRLWSWNHSFNDLMATKQQEAVTQPSSPVLRYSYGWPSGKKVTTHRPLTTLWTLKGWPLSLSVNSPLVSACHDPFRPIARQLFT